jgi:hypothetical protein
MCPHGYGTKQGPCPICDLGNDPLSRDIRVWRETTVEHIALLLGDVSQCCCDPGRARDIAQRAVTEALINVEGK